MKAIFYINITISFLVSLLTGNMYAQSFTKITGGINSDYGYHSTTTLDGGIILVGSTESFGAGVQDTADNYIVRMDESGNILWSLSMGSGSQEELFWVERTSDSNYVVCGTIRKLPVLPNELEVFKIDDSGNTLWKKRYTITGSEVAHCIRTVPGGYMLICETDNGTDYDYAAIRLDNNGDVLWSKSYGTTEFDIPIHVEPTYDGGYVLAGVSRYGLYWSSVYIVKIDSSGNFLWSKKFNTDPARSKCNVSRVLETADHGFIVSGATNADQQVINDALLIRTDSVGNVRWIYTYGEQGGDEANDMKLLSDGSYLFCGNTSSIDNTGLNDMMLMHVDSGGILLNSLAWGFAGQEDDAMSFHLQGDSAVVLIGFSDNTASGWFDIAIEKSSFASSGNCNQLQTNFRRLTCSIMLLNDATISDTLIVHTANLPLAEGHVWQDSTLCSTLTGIATESNNFNSEIYPNPCSRELHYTFSEKNATGPITCRLLDLTGKVLLEKQNVTGSSGSLDLGRISEGMYIFEIRSRESISSKKLMIVQ